MIAFDKMCKIDNFDIFSFFFSKQSSSPGNFFVLNDAFVIIDLDTVTVCVDGVSATLIPMGPSLGWPKTQNIYIYMENQWRAGEFFLEKCQKCFSMKDMDYNIQYIPDAFASNEFLMAFVTNITSG